MGEYLTLTEAAEIACLSKKRLQNLMADGTLVEGFHFTRPRGLHPRFVRAALLAWLNGKDEALISQVKRPQRKRCKVDLSLIPGIHGGVHGV